MKKTHTPRSPLTILLSVGLTPLLLANCAQTDPSQSNSPPSIPPNAQDANPVTTTDPYRGPPVSIESNTPTHTVLITAPTGGWSVLWDHKRDHQIYLTLRQPDPAFFQIQQIVRHQIDSTIPTSQPLEVFVRMVAHNDQTNTAPYTPAARTDN